MKKLLLVIALTFSFATAINAQTDSINRKNQIFTYVEQMPEFPGGNAARVAFLQRNLHYPDSARVHEITGRVVIRFVVTETGQIENVSVMKSAHPWLDDEALRVVKSMPPWTPGKNDGKPVRVYFTMPLVFSLD